MYRINLTKPNDLDKKAIRELILFALKSGKRTHEIMLNCEFVASDSVMQSLTRKFRKIKNELAFNLKINPHVN